MKFPTFICGLLASSLAVGLYYVKYDVMKFEKRLKKTKQSICEAKEAIHILKAEFSYLNEPQRLQALATKYLEVKPLASHQMVSMQTVMGAVPLYDKKELDNIIAEISFDDSNDPDKE